MSKHITVVFRKDIERAAKVGEIKEVAGGFWRNYLLPRNLAVLAGTKEARQLIAQRVVEEPPAVAVPPPVKPVVREEQRAKRAIRKEAKREKESKKSARLKAKVSKPAKGKE